ncbi:mitochondrial ribosomal protein L27 [Brevipalpus obovatus]|uniref:mitochondrial ribosomal protein L27 n=1 Tax=Brevipalpus obovatus TaxID=246614 RepID=UPI003D9F6B19
MIASAIQRISSPKIVNDILRTSTPVVISTRGGKSPAQSQGTRGAKRKLIGFMVPLGHFVHERDIFMRQKGLKFHPGLNTGFDPRDNSLFALTDGHIALTTEKFNPDYSNPIVEKFYRYKTPVRMVRYVHVLPTEPPINFKLIDLI